MKNLITLGEVYDRVDELSRNCHDSLIEVKDIFFESIEKINISGETYQIRPIAQYSVAYRLGIPLQYLKRCPEDVQAFNLNYWIAHEKNEKLFFRFDGMDVRAIFTPKYIPVDNFEILERLDSLGYRADTKVQCYLDDEFMSLSIPDGNKTFSLNGNKITPGISISNSEVGLSSLRISAFFLRLVCTNGLIIQDKVSASFRHVSRKILSEFPSTFEKVAMKLGHQREKWEISTKSTVDDPFHTIDNFNKRFQLRKSEQEAVEWGWTLEPGETMFHIVNAYTRGAQFDGLSAESRYRLQKAGGDILSMLT